MKPYVLERESLQQERCYDCCHSERSTTCSSAGRAVVSARWECTNINCLKFNRGRVASVKNSIDGAESAALKQAEDEAARLKEKIRSSQADLRELYAAVPRKRHSRRRRPATYVSEARSTVNEELSARAAAFWAAAFPQELQKAETEDDEWELVEQA
eukprot:Polyplicarium_translucidae@DN3248_c0_g1_i2.p1